MKTLRLFLFLVFSFLTLTSCRAQRELTELSKLKDVETVFIGKPMLKLAGSAAGSQLNMNGFDGSKLINKLSSIEIVTTERPSSIKEANKILDGFISRSNLEVLTEINDGEDHVFVSGQVDTVTNVVKTVLLRVSEPDEITVILLKGDIPVEMIGEAIKGNI